MRIFLLSVLLLTWTSVAHATLFTGLVGQFQFEGDATNSVAGANDGVVFGGVTFTAGIDGQAASFDGTGRIQINDAESFFGADPDAWSVAFWMRQAAIPASQQTLVGDYNGNGGHDSQFGFHIANVTSGEVSTESRVVPDNAVVSSGIVVADDSWRHVTMTASKTSGLASLYIDGNLVGTDAMAVGDHFDTEEIHLGAIQINSGFQQFYGGLLDDVRFYDRTLSADEAGILAGVPGPAAGGLALLAAGGLLARRRRDASA